jgi:hypothetical protein
MRTSINVRRRISASIRMIKRTVQVNVRVKVQVTTDTYVDLDVRVSVLVYV